MDNTVLGINNLSKKYKNTYALNHVTLTIEKGKIYGLIGQNGAGKTTLMRILLGIAYQTEGEIFLFN